MTRKKKAEGKETIIYEGRLAGIFKGFRNYDTIFRFLEGTSWRQDEYLFEYHFLDSPRAKIVKIVTNNDHKEIFYIEVAGVASPVQVKAAYV